MKKTTEAQLLREWKKLRDHYLLDGWELKFTNAKQKIGECIYDPQFQKCKVIHGGIINISKAYMEINPYQIMVKDLYHEVAHAIEFNMTGDSNHGNGWKRLVMLLGGDPERHSNKDYKHPKAKYKTICPKCKTVVKYYRKPNYRLICLICCPSAECKSPMMDAVSI